MSNRENEILECVRNIQAKFEKIVESHNDPNFYDQVVDKEEYDKAFDGLQNSMDAFLEKFH